MYMIYVTSIDQGRSAGCQSFIHSPFTIYSFNHSIILIVLPFTVLYLQCTELQVDCRLTIVGCRLSICLESRCFICLYFSVIHTTRTARYFTYTIQFIYYIIDMIYAIFHIIWNIFHIYNIVFISIFIYLYMCMCVY